MSPVFSIEPILGDLAKLLFLRANGVSLADGAVELNLDRWAAMLEHSTAQAASQPQRQESATERSRAAALVEPLTAAMRAHDFDRITGLVALLIGVGDKKEIAPQAAS